MDKPNITILIDTREKQLSHITKDFEFYKVPFKFKALKKGDYSFKVDDESFDNSFFIERKNSLEEISTNLSFHRERFKKEFDEAGNITKIILIENASLERLFKNDYRTKFNNKAFIASLLSWKFKYNIHIDFINPQFSGAYIYYCCYYFYRALQCRKAS